MSATLYREGEDLDALLDELDAEHPGRVHVVEVSYPRSGGVGGFFAKQRVGVEYALADKEPPSTVRSRPAPVPAHLADRFDDLLAAAEATETTEAAERREALQDEPKDESVGDNAEFAKLVLELAARKSAERQAATKVITAPVLPRIVAEVPAPVVVAASVEVDLPLRRKLAELGVPIEQVPHDVPHPYAAVEQLVGALPPAPPVPTGSGAVLVVAGPSRQLQRVVDHLAPAMRLQPQNLWTTQDVPGANVITGARHATMVATAIRAEQQGPAVVVIATDDLTDSAESAEDAGHADLLAALDPDALWVHVDATRKAADTRRLLRRLGGNPSALVVTGANATASPATVWELDVPVALLDGRLASRSQWAVLLLDKLAELDH